MSPTQLTHDQSSNKVGNHQIIVIAENIHSPENVGAIFRICDAMGVEKIYLTGISPDLKNRKVKKTARDTHERLPSETINSTADLIPQLKEKGYHLIALEITDKSVALDQISFSVNNKYAVLIGSERNGIQEDTLQWTDQSIHIPMFGKNSSMNVATALGIGLWEMVRQMN